MGQGVSEGLIYVYVDRENSARRDHPRNSQETRFRVETFNPSRNAVVDFSILKWRTY